MTENVPVNRVGEIDFDNEGRTIIYAKALEDITKGKHGRIIVRLQKRGDITSEGKATEDVKAGQFSWFIFEVDHGDPSETTGQEEVNG